MQLIVILTLCSASVASLMAYEPNLEALIIFAQTETATAVVAAAFNLTSDAACN